MKLSTALDECSLQLRRRRRGEAGRAAGLALEALREFLLQDPEAEDRADQLKPDDVLEFLLEYYPQQETPDPAVVGALLDAAFDLGRWLADRGEPALVPLLGREEQLREAVPRALHALVVLQEHCRGEGIGAGVELEEETAGPVGRLTAGLDRVLAPGEVDLNRADLDYFTIARIAPAGLFLRSSGRDTLEEGEAGPLRLPPEAVALLRPGDILYAEIAPGRENWSLLDIFSVRPGGWEAGNASP